VRAPDASFAYKYNDPTIMTDIPTAELCVTTWASSCPSRAAFSTSARCEAKHPISPPFRDEGRLRLAPSTAGIDKPAELQPAVEWLRQAHTTSKWTTIAPMSTPRLGNTLTVLANGNVLATGGTSADTASVSWKRPAATALDFRRSK